MAAFAGSPDHKQVPLEQIALNNFEILREKTFQVPEQRKGILRSIRLSQVQLGERRGSNKQPD